MGKRKRTIDRDRPVRIPPGGVPLPPCTDPQPKELLFLSLEGPPKVVERNFIGYLKSARGICFTKGSTFAVEDIFSRDKSVYTTPEEGCISVTLQNGKLSAEILIQPYDWYFKGYRIGDRVYELKPNDVDAKLFIEGASILHFGCNYKDLCNDNDPGSIWIGRTALKEALRDLVQSNGRPKPGSVATIIVYLCEALKFQEVFDGLKLSLRTDEYSRLIQVIDTTPEMLREWSVLSRRGMVYLQEVRSNETPKPLTRIHDIPWSDSPMKILEKVKVLYVRALQKTEAKRSLQKTEAKSSLESCRTATPYYGSKRGLFTEAIIHADNPGLPSRGRTPVSIVNSSYLTEPHITVRSFWEIMVEESCRTATPYYGSKRVQRLSEPRYRCYKTARCLYYKRPLWENMVEERIAQEKTRNRSKSSSPQLSTTATRTGYSKLPNWHGELYARNQIHIAYGGHASGYTHSEKGGKSERFSCAGIHRAPSPAGDPCQVQRRVGYTMNSTYFMSSHTVQGAFEAQLERPQRLARLMSLPAMMLKRRRILSTIKGIRLPLW